MKLVSPVLVLLFSAAALAAPPRVELRDYMGTWYEIARTPSPHEADCTCTSAHYGIIYEDTVEVHHACRLGRPNGQHRQIKGSMDIIDRPNNAKYALQYEGHYIVEYWIRALDPEYRWAVVTAGQNGKRAWLLSRSRVLAPALRAEAIAEARAEGVDVAALRDTVQDGCE